jgi:hypothetical protein
VTGSLNKKGGRRCNLLLNKRWNLLPSFLSNEPGTDLQLTKKDVNVKLKLKGTTSGTESTSFVFPRFFFYLYMIFTAAMCLMSGLLRKIRRVYVI